MDGRTDFGLVLGLLLLLLPPPRVLPPREIEKFCVERNERGGGRERETGLLLLTVMVCGGEWWGALRMKLGVDGQKGAS